MELTVTFSGRTAAESQAKAAEYIRKNNLTTATVRAARFVGYADHKHAPIPIGSEMWESSAQIWRRDK
jgi:hypothetical protein